MKTLSKKFSFLTSFIALIVIMQLILPTYSSLALSGSEFQAGRIIDNSKFFNAPTMSGPVIQAFLNSKVPTCDTNGTTLTFDSSYNDTVTRAVYSQRRGVSTPFTCLKNFVGPSVVKPAETGLCNGYPLVSQSAAEMIYGVSESCGINPQVLIVLLQKEQSLITDDWPWPIQYRSATGYGCPDTAPCDAEYYGFFNQVYAAARQFKRYSRDANLFNYRAGFNNFIQYNPNAACGGTTVYIENQATAGLYNYTPYQPNPPALANLFGIGDGCSAYGNRNFWRLFNEWFGPTTGPPDYSCKLSTNVPAVSTGPKIISNQFTSTSYATFTLAIPNNTGTGCIEAHTWASNQQAWLTNVATNHPAVNPADGEVINANLYGDAKSELVFVKYINTGSGRIEVHTWDATYQKWISNVATNHPAVSISDAKVIATDSNGDGIDELILVKYRATGSGRIEVHTWAPGQQTWLSNVATNYPESDLVDFRAISANQYGDQKDELSLVKYRNTGSGRIEVHTWAPGQQTWLSNVATNHPVVDPANIEIISGNIYNSILDELILVKYRATGSGRIEVHTWAPGQQTWLSNVATNYPEIGL